MSRKRLSAIQRLSSNCLWLTILGLLFGGDLSQLVADEKSPSLKTEFGDVEIFPADNPWNQNVATLQVHSRSTMYLESIGLKKPVHPDFGTVWEGVPMGIPYVVVSNSVIQSKVHFQYAKESDHSPYPIPTNVPIEGGMGAPLDSDRHILIIDAKHKKLFELYQANQSATGEWTAGSGAIFDLTSNALRPKGWTSADAAGLPIFPGLARYDEIVEKGELRHALRFTVKKTQRAYIAPARHYASQSNNPNLPPMGLRIRLKADYDISRFPKVAQVILKGLKSHGMILADNGGDFFVSGVPDRRWNDEDLNSLKRVLVQDFEAVETGPIEK